MMTLPTTNIVTAAIKFDQKSSLCLETLRYILYSIYRIHSNGDNV